MPVSVEAQIDENDEVVDPVKVVKHDLDPVKVVKHEQTVDKLDPETVKVDNMILN